MILAWIKKQLKIASPSTMVIGYTYEYDYLKNQKDMKRRVPKDIYESMVASERIEGILNAMERYSKAKEPIPEEWVTELRERLYKRGNNAK